MWKKLLIFFSLLFVLVEPLAASPKLVKASNGAHLFYTVTIEKNKPTFHVSVEINNLNPGEFIFDFQEGRVENLEQYITNLQVRTQTQNLTFMYLGNLAWKLYQSEGVLFIDYDISKLIPFQPLSSRDIGQKEAVVYIDNGGGMFYGQYVFMKPSYLMASANDVAEIKIKFYLPSEWQLVTPYVEHDGYYEVPKITNYFLSDFVYRTIYFGKMKFYAESMDGNFTVNFGVLEEDQSYYSNSQFNLWLTNEDGVKFSTERVVLAINALAEMFGENPYSVVPVSNRFASRDEWYYQPGIFGEVQYWPPERYDETIGHLFYLWMREIWFAPSAANNLIHKGIGESYLGNKLAHEITGDKLYLGKIYYYYLVYEAAQGTKYSSRHEIGDEYYRGCVIGLWLDNLIQRETNGEKSLEDVIGYLYQKYKNTGHEISNKDLEVATDLITNQDNSTDYMKYLDGNQDIPVGDYIQPYKDSLTEFIKVLDSDNWVKDYHNYTIPFFVDIEMSIRLPLDLPMGILIESHYSEFAEYILQNYDIDKLTKEDVEVSLGKLTGEDSAGFFERWKDSYGELSLEEMKDWLRSYSSATITNTPLSIAPPTATITNTPLPIDSPTATSTPASTPTNTSVKQPVESSFSSFYWIALILGAVTILVGVVLFFRKMRR